MSQPIKGSCLCQAVKYQFHGPGYAFQYCHCSRCRKFTGSAHGSNIIIDPKNFEWLSGEDMVGRFEYPEAKHFATCFCRNCGSSLPWMSQSGISVVIPAGTLDEASGNPARRGAKKSARCRITMNFRREKTSPDLHGDCFTSRHRHASPAA
jgi:hypothetical protein